jgi:hypothetical protein
MGTRISPPYSNWSAKRTRPWFENCETRTAWIHRIFNHFSQRSITELGEVDGPLWATAARRQNVLTPQSDTVADPGACAEFSASCPRSGSTVSLVLYGHGSSPENQNLEQIGILFISGRNESACLILEENSPPSIDGRRPSVKSLRPGFLYRQNCASLFPSRSSWRFFRISSPT